MVTRAQKAAKASGLKFIDIPPCKRCGHTVAYARNGYCVRCSADYGRAHKAANVDRERQRKREWKRKNREHVNRKKWKAYTPIRAANAQKRLTKRAAQNYWQLIAELCKQPRVYHKRLSEEERRNKQLWNWKLKKYRYRNRLKKADGKFTYTQADLILKLQGNKCAYCNNTETLCVDHILPLSKLGSNKASNIQWLCKFHNDSKGARLDEDYRQLIGATVRQPTADFARMLFLVMGL